MAGASLNITIDDRELRALLQRLQARLSDLTPVFRDMGEHLLNSTRARFQSQTDPSGLPWAPLSPTYQARKRKNKGKILTLEGRLRGLLNYQVSQDALRVGTPLIYGATHQFGDPRRNIPARPFLGLSAADRNDLLDILNDYLAR